MKKVTLIILVGLLSVSYALDENWERLTPLGNEEDIITNIHFIDGQHGLIATRNTVYYTSDSGRTWTLGQRGDNGFVSPSSIEKIRLSNVNTGWVVLRDRIFKSINGGKDWEIAVTVSELVESNDFSILQILFPTSSVGCFFGGTGTGSGNSPYRTIIGKTTDGGVNWGLRQIDSFLGSYGFFLNADTGWVLGSRPDDDCLYKTVNGGDTWNSMNFNSNQLSEVNNINLVAVFFLNNNVGWIGGAGGFIVGTSNGGNIWTKLNQVSLIHTIRQIHFINENIGWRYDRSSSDSRIMKTTDGGRSWNETPFMTEQSGPGTGYNINIMDMYFDSANGWVVGNYNSIFRTRNYGGLLENVSVKPVARPRHRATSLPRVSVSGRTLNISSPTNTVYNIRLVDMRGRTSARFSASGSGSFSLAKLPSGRYIAEVKTAVSKTTTAIMVQR